MQNSIHTRIVNGLDAESHIPWQVHVRQTYGDTTDIYSSFCGGTIIDKRTVLSAAHCFTGIYGFYFQNKSFFG